jgi:hypothetical protein
MQYVKSIKVKNDAKRVFYKKGTCSRTFFYLLNREYKHPLPDEEKAVDNLAGGILQHGYQCGMLWGSSLGVGAEAFRRVDDPDKARALAILGTQNVMRSFKDKTGSHDCIDITKTDFKNKWSIPRFMFSGKFYHCFRLAGQWGPAAYDAAEERLSTSLEDLPEKCLSCASELIKKMGGTNHEANMAAGLAGGMGLSGNACGALGAAIWMISLKRIKAGQKGASYQDKELEALIQKFYEKTDYEMECQVITDKDFKSLDEHTEFIQNGGCKELLETLAGVENK